MSDANIAAAAGKRKIQTWGVLLIGLGLILSVAMVSIPNLLAARRSANDSSAVGSLRTLNTALVSYSSNDPLRGYPREMKELSPYVDAALLSGTKSGYHFEYTPIDSDYDGVLDSYTIDARPISEKTGTTEFGTDESAAIMKRVGAKMQPLEGYEKPAEPTGRRASPIARKIVRSGSVVLIVSHPEQVLGEVRNLAERLGGYVETSKLTEQTSTPSAEIRLRVPAERYQEAKQRIRSLGQDVDDERDDVRDVTGAYVDLDATLRNYRAEEAQYLEIMRRAGSIKDTLAVAEKLADVRGRIERLQGQLNVLSQQAEMADLNITLRTETVVRSNEVRWHAAAEVKAAFWSGVDSLTTYANFMLSVLFQLPVMLLWVVTLLTAFVVSWRVLRWTWRRFVVSVPATA